MRTTRRTRAAAIATTLGTAAAAVTLLSVAPTADAAAIGEEVITNGGFENADVAPWSPRLAGSTPVTVTRSTAEKASGAASLLVANRADSVSGAIQSVPLEAGDTYAASFKVKYTDPAAAASINFNMTADFGSATGGSQFVNQIKGVVAKGDWATVSGTFTVATGRSLDQLKLYIENDYQAPSFPTSFYLDDVSVKKTVDVTPPTTPPTTPPATGRTDPLERNDNTVAGSFGSFAKTPGRGNPLVTQNFGADPWAMEYDGRVYVYTTNDTQEVPDYLATGASNNYDKINQINIWSSADMINWTNHGGVNASGAAGLNKGAANSWAPSAVHRTVNGKEKFYLYYANSAGGIWVLTADSPVGPWTAPRQDALVGFNTPGVRGNSNPEADDVIWLFDPAVLIDDDGQGYLYFGGGTPNDDPATPANEANDPNTGRVIKLGTDLVSTVGEAALVDAPALFEDSGINKIGDTYYYSYCSNFSNNATVNGKALGGGNIHYMTSKNPMGPWTPDTYKGLAFENQNKFFGVGGNNHHNIFQFKGQWYLAYHAETLALALLGQGKTAGFRNTHIDKIDIAADGTITPATGTYAGPGALATLDPYAAPVSAETIAWQAGTRQGFEGDASFATKVPTTELTSVNTKDWTSLGSVDFGAGASTLTAEVQGKAGGTITVRTSGDTSSEANVVGRMTVPAGDGTALSTVSTALAPGALAGVKDVYFTYEGTGTGELFDVRSWTFAKAGTPTTSPTTPPAQTRAATTTTLKAKPARVRAGGKVTLKITVGNGATAGGLVQVRDGKWGTRTVSYTGPGTTVKLKIRGVGKHQLVATYAGTRSTLPSSDSVKVVAVRR